MSQWHGKRWLMAIETGGNQAFIFASNRTPENVGASLLTAHATTTWVDDAIGGAVHTVVQRASGRSLVLFAGENDARRVAANITLRALRDAPGLDAVCAVVECPDVADASMTTVQMSNAILAVNRALEAARAARLGPAMRFPRLPVAASCASTSLPAAAEHRDPEGWVARSAVAIAKRNAEPGALQAIRARIEAVGEIAPSGLLRSSDKLERVLQDNRWIAVVHADGNAIGQLFVSLRDKLLDAGAAAYLTGLAGLSAALERVGLRAFARAAGDLPVVPLVLGGDDITVLARGTDALQFTVRYLKELERASADEPAIVALAPSGRLAACAGVAVVKAHHPFSDAYALAEKLADAAKRVKTLVVDDAGAPVACSAIDFHLLYSSSVASLEADRKVLESSDAVLHGRPYVITPLDRLEGQARAQSLAWAQAHAVKILHDRVVKHAARGADGPGRAARGQITALRGALGEGPEVAAARARLVILRHPELGSHLDGDSDGDVLFAQIADGAGGTLRTSRLLDVLDAAELQPDGVE